MLSHAAHACHMHDMSAPGLPSNERGCFAGVVVVAVRAGVLMYLLVVLLLVLAVGGIVVLVGE